ncbi:MAG: LysR family transcriptional regulator, partial [Gammaproteobacteria bacterium]|nr:LysR family transcriptional regulator [Gammaproteobacteria bacterium]
MNWTELTTFVAVADCLSFSQAAIKLKLTQPAVSKRIQALEAQLGTILFDRLGKRVYLTDAGHLLQPRARTLLQSLADTERLLQNLNNRIEGALRLATSHHVGLHRLAPVLKNFTHDHAAVKLDIRFEDSEAAHDLVRRADSELAVVTLDPKGSNDLHYHPLWDDPLCFVVSEEHDLARAGFAPLKTLATEPVILPGLATYTGRIVVEVFAAMNIPLQPVMSTNYLETISMLVGTGLGWSVLPRSMVHAPMVALATDAPHMHRT